MKKLLLCGLSVGVSVSMIAQNNASTQAHQVDPAIKYKKTEYVPAQWTGMENVPLATSPKGKFAPTHQSPMTTNETIIGMSNYDLQSNAAMGRRLENLGSGKFGATWTFSLEQNTTWSDRGAGYNAMYGGAWGAQPTARIESVRTGWPVSGTTAGGKEVVMTHDPANDRLIMNERNPGLTGTWTETTMENMLPSMALWHRMAIGGPSGNTIHLIALSAPVSFGGSLVNGMDGALLYSRSTDQGATWDTPIQIPGMDTSAFVPGIGGDSYAIDAKGNTVAIVVAETGQPVYMWKSSDNGVTWTRKMCLDNTIGKWDESENPNPIGMDTIPTGGGACAVLIDNNDLVHVAFDKIRVMDDAPNDGSFSVFLSWYQRLGYWNENMNEGEDFETGAPLDTDGSGTLLDAGLAIERYGNTANLISNPTFAVDANNEIFLTYTAITEFDDGASYYRHAFGMSTRDDGCSWTTPIPLTYPSGSIPGTIFDECVFATNARMAEDSVYLLYQKDFVPGNGLASSPPVLQADNEMRVVAVPLTDYSSTYSFCNASVTGESVFCLGDSVELTGTCGSAYAWSTGETTASIWAKSHQDYIVTVTTNCGNLVDTITTSAPATAPTVAITGATEACPGDSTTLTATNIPGGFYMWGGVTSSTNTAIVTDTGTYTVTVTNCAGSANSSFYVALPGAPTATISGTSTICAGDSTMLTAGAQSGASYIWSSGDTTQSIYASSVATYVVTISNCGGTASDSVAVTMTPPPTNVTVSAFGFTTFCEGGSVGLNATQGYTYLWSDGTTTSSTLTATTSGDYYYIAYNACMDSAISDTVTVTVYLTPSTPVVSQANDSVFTSDATTGNQWFVNGSAQQGETNDTLIFTPPSGSSSITVQVTDSNGCQSVMSAPVTVVGINGGFMVTGELTIYPNPSNGLFNVRFENVPTDNYTVRMRNVLGQDIFAQQYRIEGNFFLNLDLTTIEKGVYFLTISDSKSEKTKKVIIK